MLRAVRVSLSRLLFRYRSYCSRPLQLHGNKPIMSVTPMSSFRSQKRPKTRRCSTRVGLQTSLCSSLGDDTPVWARRKRDWKRRRGESSIARRRCSRTPTRALSGSRPGDPRHAASTPRESLSSWADQAVRFRER